MLAEERETIIRSDDSVGVWSIYTTQQKLITRLKKANIFPIKVDEDGTNWYENVPFNQVSFRAASTRTMSVENKAKAAERLSKAREAKNK
jgi:hypothetical protein